MKWRVEKRNGVNHLIEENAMLPPISASPAEVYFWKKLKKQEREIARLKTLNVFDDNERSEKEYAKACNDIASNRFKT